MRVTRWLNGIVLLVSISICGCDKPLPDLKGIDREQFAEDRNACNRIRSTMRKAINEQKEKLLSLNQMQVVKLLGRPDVNELSQRNQKFFYYYLDPAPDCKGNPDSSAERLVIRFNAVGLAKEVALL